jgi:hypothetical protein
VYKATDDEQSVCVCIKPLTIVAEAHTTRCAQKRGAGGGASGPDLPREVRSVDDLLGREGVSVQ